LSSQVSETVNTRDLLATKHTFGPAIHSWATSITACDKSDDSPKVKDLRNNKGSPQRQK
jgi:hypothetical protein